MSTIRSVLGFAIFAVAVILALKLAIVVFGLALGLAVGILPFALLGFGMYLILKLVAPHTAARVRQVITGKAV